MFAKVRFDGGIQGLHPFPKNRAKILTSLRFQRIAHPTQISIKTLIYCILMPTIHNQC